MFLYRWMIETGDPVDVIAKGFNLDVVLTRQLFAGSIRQLPRRASLELAEAIGLREIETPGGQRS